MRRPGFGPKVRTGLVVVFLCPKGAMSSSPRVAASATLGNVVEDSPTATRLRNSYLDSRARRNRFAVETQIGCVPQGSRSGNPGLEDRAPSGQP